MKQNTSVAWINRIIALICMFMVVFLPPISSISITYIMMVIMVVYIIVHGFIRGSFAVVKYGGIKLLYGFIPFIVFIAFQMILNIYYSHSEAANDAYLYNFSHIIIAFVYAIVCSYFFVTLYSSFEKNTRCFKSDFIRCIIIVAIIQTVLILASYFSSSVHDSFLSLFLNNTKNEVNREVVSSNAWRAHGLSSFYFDSLSLVLAGVSLISIAKAFESGKVIYYIAGILVLLASFLGARTGIILFLCGFLILFIYYVRINSIPKTLKWIIIVILSLIGVYFFFSLLSEGVRDWINKGFNAVISMITDNTKDSAFGEIFGADIVFPNDIVFGLGAKPESLNYYDNFGNYIDNGYIQIIWRFGIVGLILLLFGIINFFKSVYRCAKDSYTKILSIAFLIIMLMYLFKFYPGSSYGVIAVFFVFPAVLYSASVIQLEERYHER